MTRKKSFKLRQTVLSVMSVLNLLSVAQSEAATPVFINEIHYDNTGADIGEAVEIAGPAGTNLTGWRVIPYNGTGGVTYTPAPTLSGAIPNQGGTGFGVVRVNIAGLQNGAPDGIALVDAANNVVQFLSYEGSFTATNGPAQGNTSINIGVSESGSEATGQALRLSGNGANYEDFTWNSPAISSFGEINAGQIFTGAPPPPPPVSSCGQADVAISAIQGSGSDSPMVGTVQAVEAIVVGDFQGSAKLSGFFVQEEDINADGDPATSEGIFIASGSPVNVGDKVHIVGAVSETFNMTRIESVTSVDVCSISNALPATVTLTLPFDPVSNNPESREGMLVNLPQTLTVSENFDLARFGEVLVSSGGRLLIPTQVVSPGTAAVDFSAQNQLNQLIIDDGSNIQNPDPVIYPGPTGLSADNTLRSGYSVSNALGVLAFGFGTFRLEPTEAPVFQADNARTTTPPPLPGVGSLKVASFNILNYFNGNGSGGGFPTARGASTSLEFIRQRDKIINAIIGLNADVVGLIEVENDGYGPNSAIANLVNGLNVISGAGTYNYINPGITAIGTDQIAVGLIYKPAKVSLVGSAVILDSSVNPNFIDTLNRPALAQSFRDKTSNKIVTVAVNHLKSKGSDCIAVSDPDILDGQGNCNLTRTSAAVALAEWLNGDPTNSGENNYLIIGDLNSYAKEDPITALNDRGFVNLLENFVGNESNNAAYSFVFGGESGTLDYALANSTLAQQISGVEEWHINADEPRALDYNTEFKSVGQIASFYSTDVYRASDHDPLLLELFVPGDLDNDGDVDNLDLARFRSSLGKCIGTSGFVREADYDNSQCTTYADYRVWYRFYSAYLANIVPG